MPVTVQIEWSKFILQGTAKWRDVKSAILKEYDAHVLRRCVYVLRLSGPFAIQYVNRASPTLYIGRGKLQQRITSHLKWINELAERIEGMKFQLWLCQPRVQNAQNAYADFEAELLNRFYARYGCVPMFNRRLEKPNRNRRYIPEGKVRASLGLGSGRTYHWALTPLPSNSGYERYSKGPIDIRYKLLAMLEDHLVS